MIAPTNLVVFFFSSWFYYFSILLRWFSPLGLRMNLLMFIRFCIKDRVFCKVRLLNVISLFSSVIFVWFNCAGLESIIDCFFAKVMLTLDSLLRISLFLGELIWCSSTTLPIWYWFYEPFDILDLARNFSIWSDLVYSGSCWQLLDVGTFFISVRDLLGTRLNCFCYSELLESDSLTSFMLFW